MAKQDRHKGKIVNTTIMCAISLPIFAVFSRETILLKKTVNRLYLPLRLCLICIVKHTNLRDQRSFSLLLSFCILTCKHNKRTELSVTTRDKFIARTNPRDHTFWRHYCKKKFWVNVNNARFPWFRPHFSKINIDNDLRANDEQYACYWWHILWLSQSRLISGF